MKKTNIKQILTILLTVAMLLPMMAVLPIPCVAADDFDLSPYEGMVSSAGVAELRVTGDGGIRFLNKIDTVKLKELNDLTRGGAVITDVKYGTLIAPVAYIKQAGAFTVEALDKLGHGINYIKVEAKPNKWYDGDTTEDGYGTFAGSIYDIRPGHYTDSFAGVGYVEITLKSGAVKYVYGNYSSVGANIYTLTTRAQSNADDYTEGQLQYINSFRIDRLTVQGDKITDVHRIGRSIYFRMGDTYAVISYTGNYGWRIRAHHENKIGAEGMGAAQALAYYLGEDIPDATLPITVSQPNASTMRLAAKDGTYVEISTQGSTAMSFYSANGTLVSRVDSITTNGKEVVVKGALADGEAVYGGGERLDTVNKRGTVMDLYTCDGWNNSATSYVAIPLFTMTRGAGLYINRYERIIADFGKTESSTWSVEVENDTIDFYVFASTDMKDAIEGYTKLTGEADKPEEWAYGVMLCRYSSDLTTLDGQNAYANAADIPNVDNIVTAKNGSTKLTDWLASGNTPKHNQLFYEGANYRYIYLKNEDYPNGAYVVANKDGAPSGRSVKELVNKMIEAGMKPTSVIMEPWSWGSFNVVKREELRETCAWLDTLGIRAMLYMRVASTISTSMPGYRDSYLLHAWVTTNGETTYTTAIPDVAYNGENPDAGKVGATHKYVDITNPQAMEWYLDTVWGDLVDLGVDGVKIDFCETFPDEYKSYGVGTATTTVKYDWHDSSKIVSGTEHHAYPTYFISAFYDRMNELKESKGMTDGFFVLTRGGGIGSQRSPYMWAGDQARNFDKLDDQIMAVVNSGLSGIPFMSYDMAGYRYGGGGTSYTASNSLEYESGVFARAIEFTVFMPNIQTHGTVRNAYELTPEAQTIYKNFLALREELMPYLVELVDEACTTGIPVTRHPVLHYQSDSNVYNLKTQFMLGDGLMVAPILRADVTTTSIYLPKGNWTNLLTGQTYEVGANGQWLTVKANLGQVPVFLNDESADAAQLREIFASDAWTAIKNYK